MPLGEGRLGLVVADVSGKGIPAALIMATFRAALRTEMRRHADPGAVAAQLNRAVLESGDTSRFVTAVFGVLDAASGRFTYVNCGHNPPLLLRGAAEAGTSWSRGGPALGLFDAPHSRSGAATLAPGDRLVLYTDGVVEPTNDRRPRVRDGAARGRGARARRAGPRPWPCAR